MKDGQWSMDGEVSDGHIYELAFDGSDARAEVIERTTGLSFLGDATDPYDSERPCHMTGETDHPAGLGGQVLLTPSHWISEPISQKADSVCLICML